MLRKQANFSEKKGRKAVQGQQSSCNGTYSVWSWSEVKRKKKNFFVAYMIVKVHKHGRYNVEKVGDGEGP